MQRSVMARPITASGSRVSRSVHELHSQEQTEAPDITDDLVPLLQMPQACR